MRKDKFLALAASVAFGLGVIVGGNNPAFAASGEKVFKTCKGCHTIKKGGKNKFGPNLFGAFGREAGTAKGYKYKGLKGADWKWEEANLDVWLTNPKKFIKAKGRKRTSMSKRVNKASDRKAVIEYLKKMR